MVLRVPVPGRHPGRGTPAVARSGRGIPVHPARVDRLDGIGAGGDDAADSGGHGAEDFDARDRAAVERRETRRLEALGYRVTVEPRGPGRRLTAPTVFASGSASEPRTPLAVVRLIYFSEEATAIPGGRAAVPRGGRAPSRMIFARLAPAQAKRPWWWKHSRPGPGSCRCRWMVFRYSMTGPAEGCRGREPLSHLGMEVRCIRPPRTMRGDSDPRACQRPPRPPPDRLRRMASGIFGSANTGRLPSRQDPASGNMPAGARPTLATGPTIAPCGGASATWVPQPPPRSSSPGSASPLSSSAVSAVRPRFFPVVVD